MPTRRTSPRRALTRPPTRPTAIHEPGDADPPQPWLASVAPWIALLALAVAVVSLTLVFLNRGSNLDSCRQKAWGAIPDSGDLPQDWSLGSTDMNANGMTVSILGPASSDTSTPQPAVYASVTCYGDAAAAAMSQNKAAAEAAGANVTSRAGSDAYDVDNPATGSVTTLFRVGSLIGQVADAGSASPSDLATITKAVAAAMGDENAAGTIAADASNDAGASNEPLSSDAGVEPSASSAAPELEAKLPTEIGGTQLTIQSASADQVFGGDPNSRALSARIRALGAEVSDLQIAQAFDDSGAIDLQVTAFRLPGKDGAKLSEAVIDTWLSANAAGVTKSEVTLGGKKVTKIDYGDAGTVEYVYVGSDFVIVIDTADPAIAAEVASKLK